MPSFKEPGVQGSPKGSVTRPSGKAFAPTNLPGQYAIEADRLRGECQTVRKLLFKRKALPGGELAPEFQRQRKDKWEQGFVPAFMPSMWYKLQMNTDVTKQEILQRINIQAYPGLLEEIERETRLDEDINHITGFRYDTASAEFKEFAQTLVPPDHWNTIVPPDLGPRPSSPDRVV